MTNKTILICDDDEGILDMLEIVLEGNGYHIIPVQNSLNLYEVIDREHPDLLLLDLWMPVLSGDQVLRSLRKNPDTQDLPVIVISASRDGQQIAVNAGANDFMAKPFDVDFLLQKIQEYVN
ncbi:two-component system, OmpR family, alkaline phosphatase synthesis response regulator PhoP/two-component system, OmpR family, response regulator MtrA [Mucilaginibacter pineti]|uniref:Two-component system, OmpR family, alkaline phosphatase synthesis response regulator PhoP/two-component system, OmpR family, response regulator MtrA n=1 Tax=Mucilaginibacter pineti TaxID=1391627 RepID=A0A1G7LB17_9SPHI|nr:response regulator [Mucilaginibacter pineti]SDF46504.1 two-component system, OmpR family, alkaline phosphatase synthesis response regulator PhoP/two-component system, OmpR family, response regulator MtrA [Mucilaginibacter pineti]